MPILRLSLKRYKVANKVERWRRIRIGDDTRKPVRLMKIVAMDIRLYVATMTNIVNTLASIEVKRCLQIYGKDARRG